MYSQKDSWSTECRAHNLDALDFFVCLTKKEVLTQFRTITFTKSVVFHLLQHQARSLVLWGPAQSRFLRDFDSCGPSSRKCSQLMQWNLFGKILWDCIFCSTQILTYPLSVINVIILQVSRTTPMEELGKKSQLSAFYKPLVTASLIVHLQFDACRICFHKNI